MSETAVVSELEEIQKLQQVGEVPLGELHRLLDLHHRRDLHDKRTIEDYLSSGVCDQQVVYYADPVDVVGMRQQQGLKPDSLQCVKSGSMEFDVAQFNKELLKRAQRAVTRQRQLGIIQIGEPDEAAAKVILDKAQEKLAALGRRDKPAILDALLTASTEARFVEDAVVENLQAIGCIALVNVGGETRVSYKWQHKLGEYVKRLLKQHDASITDFCTAPERQRDTTDRFTAEVKSLIREMKVEDGSGLEKVKPESLMVLDRLERMVESRPKTLKGLRNVIKPVAKTVFITPLNVTFAKLTGHPLTLKTIKFPFSETSTFPFSLTTQKIFEKQEKAAEDASVGVKEAKKFYRKVFGNFHKPKKTDENVQYRLASDEMKNESVRKLQEWLDNREKGVRSDCEANLRTTDAAGDVSDNVLEYNLPFLDTAAGLPPLTRTDIYGVLAKLATSDVKLGEADVVKRLEELQVLKKHPDKIVFFVKKIKKLLDDTEKANKKITEYVSSSANRYKFKVATAAQ